MDHFPEKLKKSVKKTAAIASPKSSARPRSILRWIGSKLQLLEQIGNAVPAQGRRWIEPFAGSGVVHMAHGRRCQSQLLADFNADLIALYKLVRDDVDGFIETVRPLFDPANNTAAGFKAMKARFNALEPGDVERARVFLAINRAGFNGLVRFNKKGELTVSYGKRKSVPLHEKHLRAFSASLQGVELRHADFRDIMRQAGPGDVVYCDPPYISAFTSYTASGFSLKDQIDLAAEARAAAARGATVVVSNTDCALARELYAGADVRQVAAERYMSPKASNRGKAQEVLAVYASVQQVVAAEAVVPVAANENRPQQLAPVAAKVVAAATMGIRNYRRVESNIAASAKRVFSSNGDGSLSIMAEQDANHFARQEPVITAPGARTMAMDYASDRVGRYGPRGPGSG